MFKRIKEFFFNVTTHMKICRAESWESTQLMLQLHNQIHELEEKMDQRHINQSKRLQSIESLLKRYILDDEIEGLSDL